MISQLSDWFPKPMIWAIIVKFDQIRNTGLFLVHLYFCERKVVPVQWRMIGYGTPMGVSFKVDSI